jgi:hypothetical protein
MLNICPAGLKMSMRQDEFRRIELIGEVARTRPAHSNLDVFLNPRCRCASADLRGDWFAN